MIDVKDVKLNKLLSRKYSDRSDSLTVASNPSTSQIFPDNFNNNLPAGLDPLELAYLYIFESVQAGRDAASIQAKDLENNDIQQNKLIALEAQQNFITLRNSQLLKSKKKHVLDVNGFTLSLNFMSCKAEETIVEWVTKKVNATTLEQLEATNQTVSAIRGVMEDQITVLRQNAQLSETNMNTTSDDCQQTIQQGGSLMQMLTNLTSQIERI